LTEWYCDLEDPANGAILTDLQCKCRQRCNPV